MCFSLFLCLTRLDNKYLCVFRNLLETLFAKGNFFFFFGGMTVYCAYLPPPTLCNFIPTHISWLFLESFLIRLAFLALVIIITEHTWHLPTSNNPSLIWLFFIKALILSPIQEWSHTFVCHTLIFFTLTCTFLNKREMRGTHWECQNSLVFLAC